MILWCFVLILSYMVSPTVHADECENVLLLTDGDTYF